MVSLLRLLLVYPEICDRYTKDFMIITQILYKIGIQFEDEEDITTPADEKGTDNDDDEEEELNFMDINLLQFTSISAVSNLYHGKNDGLINIDDNFINLGLNGLRIKNCNVRLAASRLLFNLVYEIKRQYIFMINDTNDITKDYNKEIDILIKKLNKIIIAIIKYIKMEKHIPTLYRLLCIFGLISYCDNDKKLIKQLELNDDKIIKQLDINNDDVTNEQLKNLQNDLITVFA